MRSCDRQYFLHYSRGSLKITDENNGRVGEYCDDLTGKEVYVGGDYALLTMQTTDCGPFSPRGFRLSFTAAQSGKFKIECNFMQLQYTVLINVESKTPNPECNIAP